MILAGTKTQTRRLVGRQKPRVGSIHPIKRHWYDKPQGWIRVISVHEEPLGAITEADAREEGYSSVACFRPAWERILHRPWDDNLRVRVINFRLHNGPEKHKQPTLFDEREEANALPPR